MRTRPRQMIPSKKARSDLRFPTTVLQQLLQAQSTWRSIPQASQGGCANAQGRQPTTPGRQRYRAPLALGDRRFRRSTLGVLSVFTVTRPE